MFTKWLLLFCVTVPAWGYNLTADFINGFYWAQLPISFTIVDDNSSRKAAIQNLAQQAISEWESKTGLSLWDLTNSGTPNIIRWSTNFAAETRMDPNSVLAVAIRYTSGPYFARSEIIINGGHWLNQSEANLRTTITHELGHTMGLDHSGNSLAVMAPSLQSPYRGLHSDDLAGMSDAHQQTSNRQITRYVSPLAYTSETEESQPLSCGTTGVVTAGSSTNGTLSLVFGILIGFVRKIWSWVKSLF